MVRGLSRWNFWMDRAVLILAALTLFGAETVSAAEGFSRGFSFRAFGSGQISDGVEAVDLGHPAASSASADSWTNLPDTGFSAPQWRLRPFPGFPFPEPQPDPGDPPADPDPVQPDPVQPDPVKPDPVKPDPEPQPDPAPAPPDEDDNPTDPGQRIGGEAVLRATASARESRVHWTLDDNPDTDWSAAGKGQWIQYEFKSKRSLSGVLIAWNRGDRRRMNFDVLTSVDGSSWEKVINRKWSSGTTADYETYSFPASSAGFLRIVGWGNTENDWINITEARFLSGKPAEDPSRVFIELEAEEAQISGPVEVGQDSRASGGKYIEPYSKTGGLIGFDFKIPQEGRYVIWGKVVAADTSSDSFYVTLNDETQDVWHVVYELQKNTAWRWDQVSRQKAGSYNNPDEDPWVLNLRPGLNRLTLRSRETGVRLDKIIVTNDLDFIPAPDAEPEPAPDPAPAPDPRPNPTPPPDTAPPAKLVPPATGATGKLREPTAPEDKACMNSPTHKFLKSVPIAQTRPTIRNVTPCSKRYTRSWQINLSDSDIGKPVVDVLNARYGNMGSYEMYGSGTTKESRRRTLTVNRGPGGKLAFQRNVEPGVIPSTSFKFVNFPDGTPAACLSMEVYIPGDFVGNKKGGKLGYGFWGGTRGAGGGTSPLVQMKLTGFVVRNTTRWKDTALYSYHLNRGMSGRWQVQKEAKCDSDGCCIYGDSGASGDIPRGRWVRIEQELVMNSAPNKADGYSRLWIDGKQVGEITGQMFDTMKLKGLLINDMWGGSITHPDNQAVTHEKYWFGDYTIYK